MELEKSEIHSLVLSLSDLTDDGWEQVYMDWQEAAAQELLEKYGERVVTIHVTSEVDPTAEEPSKLFWIQADLEPIDEDLESSIDPLTDPASPTSVYND